MRYLLETIERLIMFPIGIHSFLNHKVIVTDWRLIQNNELRQAYRQNASMLFVAAVRATKEGVVQQNKNWRESGTEHLMNMVGKINVGDSVIYLDKKFSEQIPKDELMGMLYHEHAHIVHGDIDTTEDQTTINGQKLILSQEFELRADQYAMMMVGKETLRRGLNNALRYHAAEIAGDKVELFMEFIMQDEFVKQRFAAMA